MPNHDDLKKLIKSHKRRLQKLKEQEAIKGLSVDPAILIEIEDIKAKIKDLQEETAALEEYPPKVQEKKEKSSEPESVFLKSCGPDRRGF